MLQPTKRGNMSWTYLVDLIIIIIYANLTTRSGIVAVIARGIAEC